MTYRPFSWKRFCKARDRARINRILSIRLLLNAA